MNLRNIIKSKKIYLSESQIKMLKETNEKEIVFFEFFRDLKKFLRALLSTPLKAEPDGVLKNDYHLSSKGLKKILFDKNIISKSESFTEDYDDVKGKGISHYHILYQIPKSNFQEKVLSLYKSLEDKRNVNESCDGYIGLEKGGDYYHMNNGFGNLSEDDEIETTTPRIDPSKISVLCACEESQAVCSAFRSLGFNAYSCDIQETSGEHVEWHIMDDALNALQSRDWDVVIAFPPCTHLAASGALYWKQKQKDGRQRQAFEFFMKFVDYPCKFKAIENPVGIMSTLYRKPDQIINPSQFGDPWNKRTCLWLYGLPKLTPTNEIEATNGSWVMNNRGSKMRSKTFPGIAGAMAQQWGTYILDKLSK